jgi:histone PARylation factor 1-like protein
MIGRFPEVAERVQRVYGLRLPRHLAVFCALLFSIDAQERQELQYLGLSPFGLCDYFAEDGLRLIGRDGLDERLHGRYRRDPAEFVTVVSGGVDGLHYGLWYDDPAELPSFVAHNYARAEGETWTDGCPTLLAQLRFEIERRLPGDVTDDQASQLSPLFAAVQWFSAADEQALAEDGPRRWTADDRLRSAVCVFPAIPAGSGDPRLDQSMNRATCFAYGGIPQARDWIAQAEQELAAGRPAYALAIGSELHWADHDEYRQQSRELLIGAYRALNRPAMAKIIDIHTAHRDLASVQILITPSEGS